MASPGELPSAFAEARAARVATVIDVATSRRVTFRDVTGPLTLG